MDFEPNDSRDAAVLLAEGFYDVNGLNADWYRIDADPGTVTLQLTPDPGEDARIVVYNEAEQVIASNFPSGTPSNDPIVLTAPDCDSFYFHIFDAVNPAGGTPDYTLDVDLPPARPGVATFEGNDSQTAAKALPEGTHQIAGRNRDWFTFASEAGPVSLDLDPYAATDVRMVLYNALGQVIASNFPGGARTDDPIAFNSPANATYLVEVFAAVDPDGGCPTYTLTLDTPDAFGTDAYEANDSVVAAVALGEGVYDIAGNNRDWYRVDAIDRLGDLSVQLTPRQGTDARLVVYDEAMNVIGSNFGTGVVTLDPVTAAMNGDRPFFVEVFDAVNPDGGAARYTLNIDLPDVDRPGVATFEGNDSQTAAKTLPQGTHQIAGRNRDWFTFTADPGPVSMELTPLAGTDVRLVIYDATMQVVGSNFSDGPVVTGPVTVQSNNTSVFFAQVFSAVDADKGFPTYTLSLDTAENAWGRTLDFGPVRDASITLFDIDEDGRDEIFVGAAKGLNAAGEEIRPGGLIVLEDDGTIKWTRTFPGMPTPDPDTGKLYATTSVTTAPTFADITGDGNMDIVIGVGGDTSAFLPDLVGQPGDRGGVYALDRNGDVLWFHESRDIIGGPTNTGEGRPDGVKGSPVVYDIDRDGRLEVIHNGWDQRTWFLDAKTGAVEQEIELLDTIWSTPWIADITGDNVAEVLVSADITENSDARTITGGIFHVISGDGSQDVPGWNVPIGNANYLTLRGKAEEQTLWSSPITEDIDGDGALEIIYGTGNFHKDGRGEFIRVWNHDGTPAFKLDTNGRTYATPLAVDLDDDGDFEIVATTLEGFVHGWNHLGQSIFATNTRTFGGGSSEPIFSSPIAEDLNGDGQLEILYIQGAQLVIVDANGVQISDPGINRYIIERYLGSPAVRDVDRDGRLEMISGASTPTHDQAVVLRWDNHFGVDSAASGRGHFQAHQPGTNVEAFVTRFYDKLLARNPDAGGLNDWMHDLESGLRAGSDIAIGFVFSQEFLNRGVADADFVDLLYRAFFDREPDAGGKAHWMSVLAGGGSRESVLSGFVGSQEFFNLCIRFGIKPQP